MPYETSAAPEVHKSAPEEPVLGLSVTCEQERDAVLSEGEWETLVESIMSTRCTPFIGAGVAAPPLPLGRDLARQLAEDYRYPLTDTFNLPRVAQYVSIIRSSGFLKRKIVREFTDQQNDYYKTSGDQAPTNYKILADLRQTTYITTNYDGFLQRALKAADRSPVVETCRWNDQLWDMLGDYPDHEPTQEEPILFHLHGELAHDLSILITEDDYIDFTVTMAVRGSHDISQSALWSQIREALGYTTLLFIGYSLEDWNFRVMLKYLTRQQGIISNPTSLSMSIQLPPAESNTREDAEAFLRDYLRTSNIKVYWADAAQFLAELHSRVRDARS
jgi:SIR2-like domain